MLTFNETGAAQAVEAIRSILGLNGDVRLQVEFEAGLHPNLLAYEKIQPSGIKLPSIEKYLIGTTSMLHQPTNYFDAIHVWRCACMVQYIHAALEVLTAKCEPSLKDAKPELRYQFERLAYFALDKDSLVGSSRRDDRNERTAGPAVPTLIFNRTITLRDTWAKEARKL